MVILLQNYINFLEKKNSEETTIEETELIDVINNEIEFTINQELNHYGHGLYKLVQLKDGRIVVSSTDNNLVFWRNSDGVF